MIRLVLAVCVATIAAAAFATAAAAAPRLDPPADAVAAFGRLREIDTPAGLPLQIREGTFTLPGGKAALPWMLAAPSAAWNATDSVVDPSLPGRRLHFAMCDATLCVLHYERGGIAHVHLVMVLALVDGSWRVRWIACGQPAMPNAGALRALLENRSTASYSDDRSAESLY